MIFCFDKIVCHWGSLDNVIASLLKAISTNHQTRDCYAAGRNILRPYKTRRLGMTFGYSNFFLSPVEVLLQTDSTPWPNTSAAVQTQALPRYTPDTPHGWDLSCDIRSFRSS